MKKIFTLILVLSSYFIAFSINAPSLVSPSNGASNQDIFLNLDWTTVTGNSGYICQIDTSPNFNSSLFFQSNTNNSNVNTQTLLFGATYYWRVCTKSTVDTSTWTSAWHFTTKNTVINVSPSNGAVSQEIFVNIDWTGITGNNGYMYQLDTTPNFNSPLFLQGNSSVNSSNVNSPTLYFGTTYYWRACAKSSVDTSEWSTTSHFTTKNTIYNVTPSNGASNQDILLNLDWSGITGNNGYMYQLDTTPNFNSPLFLQGNSSVNSSNVNSPTLYFGTTYYWRACAKSSVDTSEWSSAWSFTTKNTVTNVSPSNGAINQDILINIDWTSILGNNGYMYQIDTTPSFNSPIFLQNSTAVSSSSTSVSNLYFGTTYYWRACAKSVNDTSDWSSTWSFTTKNTVTNVSPSNGAINQDVLINIDWTSILGNNGYMYQIDTTPNFNSPIFLQNSTAISSSSVSVSNLYFGTTYYWRACSKSVNDTSDWSSTWSFTTINTVTNVSPSNGATNISIDPNIDWTYVTGNDGYLCEIDTSPNFNSGLYQIVESVYNVSEVDITGLLYGTMYYWRAACKNSVDTSDWSNTWHFTTAYELTEIPNLVSPIDGSIDIPYTSEGLEWTSITGATIYQYEYSIDNTFASGVNSGTTSLITGTISSLNPNTIYYWRVRGGNGFGFSPWSVIWQFTTESAILTEPILVSPLNNLTGIDFNSVTLDWNSVFGASEYIYEISTDNTFTTGVTSETLSATDKTLVGLADDTQYFWRVKSSDGTQESAWSTEWNFTTMIDVNINDIENISFKIYPNPSTGIFTISGKGIINIEIKNINGQVIYYTSDEFRVDLINQPKGIYFVKITETKGITIKKIVLQ